MLQIELLRKKSISYLNKDSYLYRPFRIKLNNNEEIVAILNCESYYKNKHAKEFLDENSSIQFIKLNNKVINILYKDIKSVELLQLSDLCFCLDEDTKILERLIEYWNKKNAKSI